MTRQPAWIAPLAVCLMLAACPDAPADAAEEAPAGLADYLKTIAAAEDLPTASSAYAKACSLAPKDPAPRTVYLRRLLQLGLPKPALYPARSLVALQHPTPLARAVIALDNLRRRQWAKGLEDTLRAADGLHKDPGVLGNLGQLMAWKQHDKAKPKLSVVARKVWEEKKPRVQDKPAYEKGYQRVAGFYKKRNQTEKEYDAKIAAAQKDLDARRKELVHVDGQVRRVQERIKDLKSEKYRLKRQLPSRDEIKDDKSGRARRRERDLEDRIRDVERRIDQAEREERDIRRKNMPKLNEYRRKQTALKKLQQEKIKALGDVATVFQWSPPGVDGKVTAESAAALTAKPTGPALKTVPQPVGNEAVAAGKLKLARTWHKSGRDSKALDILQEIVRHYPKTAAAKEARDLILEIASQ